MRGDVIGEDLLRRLQALPHGDLLRVVMRAKSALGNAMDLYRRGKIGEAELCAIAKAVNSAIAEILPQSGYQSFAVEADRQLGERLSELGPDIQ